MEKEEILKTVEQDEIDFIDLMFSDLYGNLKSVTISPRELEDCLNNGKWFDGSSVEGFTRIHESDMLLVPDSSTYLRLPWPRGGKNVARIICDVHEPHKDPFAGDPRFILKRILEKAREKGYFFYVGPEIEFFLFRSKEERTYHDTAGYFDFSPQDFATEIRALMVSTLEKLGIQVEMTHHEVAPSQHEIDIQYSDALKTADNVMILKQAIKTVAASKGLHATFMPKPIYGVNSISTIAVRESIADIDYLMGNVEVIIRERKRLFHELQRFDFLKPFPSQANFIFCHVLKGTASELSQALRARGILIGSFSVPMLENSVRITVGKPEHNDVVINALQEIAESLH